MGRQERREEIGTFLCAHTCYDERWAEGFPCLLLLKEVRDIYIHVRVRVSVAEREMLWGHAPALPFSLAMLWWGNFHAQPVRWDIDTYTYMRDSTAYDMLKRWEWDMLQQQSEMSTRGYCHEMRSICHAGHIFMRYEAERTGMLCWEMLLRHMLLPFVAMLLCCLLRYSCWERWEESKGPSPLSPLLPSQAHQWEERWARWGAETHHIFTIILYTWQRSFIDSELLLHAVAAETEERQAIRSAAAHDADTWKAFQARCQRHAMPCWVEELTAAEETWDAEKTCHAAMLSCHDCHAMPLKPCWWDICCQTHKRRQHIRYA